MMAALHAGDAAPDLNLTTTEGDMRIPPKTGRGLIVFFYPRDNTPGCTTEAKDFSALKADFAKAGYDVLGISRDSLASHKRFTEKQSLSVPLASDEDGQACEAFGVWAEKSMYGKTFMGIVRSTFAIDLNGTIIESWNKVRVKEHVREVLSILNNL